MGYRNYFYIADKQKVNDFLSLSHEEQILVTAKAEMCEWTDQDYAKERIQEYIKENKLRTFHISKYLEAIEVVECGKYFDGKISTEIKEDSIDFSDDDCEFFFVKPEALVICAEHYKQKTFEWWSTLVNSMYMTDEEIANNIDKYPGGRPDIKAELESHINDLRNARIDILDTDLNHKYNITTSWLYEYAMFELIHIYKSVDWTKNTLIWCGY